MMNATNVKFVQALENLRAAYEFSVTSWYRSKKHNAKVGGHPASKHLIGLGVDVVLDDPRLTGQFMGAARMQNLLALDEKDHIHVQVMPGEEARRVFQEVIDDPVKPPAKTEEDVT